MEIYLTWELTDFYSNKTEEADAKKFLLSEEIVNFLYTTKDEYVKDSDKGNLFARNLCNKCFQKFSDEEILKKTVFNIDTRDFYDAVKDTIADTEKETVALYERKQKIYSSSLLRNFERDEIRKIDWKIEDNYDLINRLRYLQLYLIACYPEEISDNLTFYVSGLDETNHKKTIELSASSFEKYLKEYSIERMEELWDEFPAMFSYMLDELGKDNLRCYDLAVKEDDSKIKDNKRNNMERN